MRYAIIALVFGVLSIAMGTLRAAPIDDLPAPIVTRQAVFSIPFTVPPVDVNQQPAEVRLLASGDRGVSWQVTDRVILGAERLPYKGGFTFRAPADGEYWFAIRTADRQGQMRVDRNGLPELRVVVDTRPPRLDFSAIRGEGGEIVARCQAVDPNLKPDSLKLQYQSSGNPQWQIVAIDPPTDTSRSSLSQSATWWPANASGVVTVKAEVSDVAGNTTVAQAQVNLQQNANAASRSRSDDPVPPTASMNRSVMTGPNRTAKEFSNGTPSGATARSDNRSQFDTRGPSGFNAGYSGGTPWQPDAQTDLPLGRGTAESSRVQRSVEQRRDQPIVDDVGPIEGPSLFSPAQDRRSSPVPREAESAVHPPVGSQYTPTTRFDFALPPGAHLRMVNSTTFDLDYDVESVGRSGIAKVELWITRDGGRSWNNAGVDPDNRSPFRTTVDAEGVYGYRLTVQSGSGLGGKPPQPGDLPEVWIGVDLTRPTARLLSAERGTGDHAGELIIRYEAGDALLSDRPITLSQSAQPGGPWTTIAAGLANSGQFVWRFDESASERVYLRLEVRDEAGNVGAFESSDPVVLERILPQGRLRNVRPVGDSARLAAPRAALGASSSQWQR